MKTVFRLLLLTLIFMLSACSDVWHQRLYEGIRMRNDGLKTPEERAMSPSPSYGTYKKERETLNK